MGSAGRTSTPLGRRILVGVLVGIALGIFLGELAAPLDVAGKVYVALLQMTVLPYVTVSLMTKVGGLSLRQARTLAGRAGAITCALWAVCLVMVLGLSFSLPEWQAGSFFSASLVERPERLDFIELYLPTNPFHSLANNVVPAVVLFSILVGVALIGVERRNVLIEPLSVVGEALGRISNFVVRLSPWGTFALTAGAAGRLEPDDLIRLGGYVSTYTVAIVVLALVVFPTLVAAVTPIRARAFLGGTRDALLTAFATGKLFAVLPMVIQGSQRLLVAQGMDDERATTTANVFVPLAYPFPNAGKLASLLFIPFAGWFVGRPLELSDFPLLFSVGVFAFFGSPVAAIPFLLDLLRLPSDLLPLFLIAGIWCARLGDTLGTVHLAAFTVIAAAWDEGWLRLRSSGVARWLALSTLTGIVAIFANKQLVSAALATQPRAGDIIESMELHRAIVEITGDDRADEPNAPLLDGESLVARIGRTGELRVGYVPDGPPFAYRNAAGRVVGFDVDLIQHLAAELGVTLRLVPVAMDAIADGFDADRFDLAVGGIPSSLRNLERFDQSSAYLELHAALIVADHRVRDFQSLATIRQLDSLRVGYARGGHLVRTGRNDVGDLELVEVADPGSFLAEDDILGAMEVDAFLTTAERGAVLAMRHPQLSVVVPEGVYVKVPVVFAVQRSSELDRVVDTWIELQRDDGTIETLYDHWILGKRPIEERSRWSVVRDVLGWVD